MHFILLGWFSTKGVISKKKHCNKIHFVMPIMWSFLLFLEYLVVRVALSLIHVIVQPITQVPRYLVCWGNWCASCDDFWSLTSLEVLLCMFPNASLLLSLIKEIHKLMGKCQL